MDASDLTGPPGTEPPPGPRAADAAPRGRARALAAVVAWLALHAGVAAWLQLGFLHVVEDADTDYHVAVGRLIREHGLLHAFPWTPFSILADHYADKELLFHLLFVPFAGLDPALAANAVGTLSGAALLGGSSWCSGASGSRWRACGRSSRCSPPPPSSTGSRWSARTSCRSRWRWWCSGPPPASGCGCWPSRRRSTPGPTSPGSCRWCSRCWPRGPARWAAAALGGGRRPSPPPGWWPAWRSTPTASSWSASPGPSCSRCWSAAPAGRPGLELGDEFRPFTLGEWSLLLVPPVAMAVAALGLAWRRRRADALPLAFALAAAAFLLLTLRTARFTEYLVPFSVAAFALTAGAMGAGWRGPRRAAMVAVTLLACAAYSGRESRALLGRLAAREPRFTPEEVAALRARIPAGAQVFTCQWGLTGTLMLALPDRRFVVALDPTFFALKDPERYALWYRLPREAPPGLAATIRERFGARYAACIWEERFRPFFDRIAFEPGVSTVLVSGLWNVYELREP